MTQVSIANLPAFVGTGPDSGDLLVGVDVSDTTESPLGTTKRFTSAQWASPQTNITGHPFVIATGAPPSTAGLLIQTNGSARWEIATNGGAESGGDAGSDLVVTAFHDDGTVLDQPFTIDRVTGGSFRMNRATIFNRSLTVNATFATTGPVVIGTDPGGSSLLRVGGTITAGSVVSATNFNVNLGQAILTSNQSSQTWPMYLGLVNAGANVLIGIEGASGSQLLGGASPYAFALGQSVAGRNVEVFTNNAKRLTVDSAGGVVISTDPGGPNVLRVGGSITVGSGAAADRFELGRVSTSYPTFDYSGASSVFRLLNAAGSAYVGLNCGAVTSSGSVGVGPGGGYYIGGNVAVGANPSYTILYGPDGTPALQVGGTDPTNYHSNSTHIFRNRAGSTNFGTLTVNGLSLNGTLAAQNGTVTLRGNFNYQGGAVDVAGGTVGNTTNISIGDINSYFIAFITADNGDSAMISCCAPLGNAIMGTAIRGNWSTVIGTANSHNVYWGGDSHFHLQNNSGATHTYFIMRLGGASGQ